VAAPASFPGYLHLSHLEETVTLQIWPLIAGAWVVIVLAILWTHRPRRNDEANNDAR